MKQTYFTFENIKSKADKILQDVHASTNIRTAPFQFERSALLILDMQNYFLDRTSHAFIPSAECIIPGIRNLAERFLKYRLPVYLTRHVNDPSDAGMMADWWSELIKEGHPMSQLIDGLQLEGAEVLMKSQYDAFYNTMLARKLLAKHVDQLIITGVMTHLCCETTARSAFVHGFKVFFPVDGTATYSEVFHRASCINLGHGFAHMVTMDNIHQWIDERTESLH